MRRHVVSLLAYSISGVAVAQAPGSLSDLDGIGRGIARDKCKKPEHVAVRKATNRYEPSVTDEVVTYRCPGMRIVVYRANYSAPAVEHPAEVTLSRPYKALPPTLDLGATAASVRTSLGKPYSQKGGRLVYSLSAERPGQDTLTFVVKDERVHRLVWEWDID